VNYLGQQKLMETETLPQVQLERVKVKPKKGQTFVLVRNPLDDHDDDDEGDYKPGSVNQPCSSDEEDNEDEDVKPIIGYVL